MRKSSKKKVNMLPLESDIGEDDEETMSFLPSAPVIHVRVPKSSRRKKIHCCLCRPWVYKSLIFMIVFISILGFKFYSAVHGSPFHRHAKGESVVNWHDLHLNDIGHWCLQPNVTDCKCANPLLPQHRYGHKTWTKAHMENVGLARNIKKVTQKSSSFRELDVVFLGDSITEGWRGTSFGEPIEHKQENKQIFEKYFDMEKSSTAKMEGLVLGIAGDKSPNLLWRLQNGEIPKSLNSKVYWVLIGTNDFLKEDLSQCSEEVVFMGIERVVAELQILKPDATIVVNGLLPRSDIGRGKDGRLYKENKKTVMDAIDTVNHLLKEYCDEHKNLVYFDASDIFIDSDSKLGRGKFSKYIPFKLMEDSLHPTVKGYEKFAEKITIKLEKIMKENLLVAT